MTRVNRPNAPVNAALLDVADLIANPPNSLTEEMRRHSLAHPSPPDRGSDIVRHVDPHDVPMAQRGRGR